MKKNLVKTVLVAAALAFSAGAFAQTVSIGSGAGYFSDAAAPGKTAQRNTLKLVKRVPAAPGVVANRDAAGTYIFGFNEMTIPVDEVLVLDNAVGYTGNLFVYGADGSTILAQSTLGEGSATITFAQTGDYALALANGAKAKVKVTNPTKSVRQS